MEVFYKKLLFWFGLSLVLPIVSLASGVNSTRIVDNGINFDTYTIPADYDKIAQEADNVSKYISYISGDGFENPLYIPRIYAASNAGTDLAWQTDVLVPMVLTTDQTSVFYLQGRYSPGDKKSWEYSTWTGSMGFLYRQIGSAMGMDDSVLGAYVLGDYNRAASGHRYWVIGPGVESLGRTWDFRLNGYIPTGSRFLENKAWAREFGEYNYTEFEEGTNNIYDHRLAYYEEKGIGGDFEVGRKLFKFNGVLVKGYMQGYYYRMEHATNILGGGLKITAQPAKYITFSINNSYDKYQHNVFMLGAQIRLNNLFNRANQPLDENVLANRLLDPISRNYGNIGNGTSSPVIKTSLRDFGKNLYSSNAVFFADHNSGYISPNAAQYRKGTYGNPYTEEGDVELRGMQVVLDEIRGNFSGQVFMLFAPGSYQASDSGLAINLYNNMSIFGRDYWYITPTSDNQRALFLGSINLFGSNILDSMRIQDASPFASGLAASGASNIVLNNIEVGTLSGTGNYATGIIMDGSNITLTNSKIYAYQSGAALADDQMNAVGIEMINGGSLVVSNSEIKGIANETSEAFNNTGNGHGIRADGIQETITMNANSSIVGQGQGGFFNSGNGYGILIGSNILAPSIASASISGNVVTISNGTVRGEGRNTSVEYSGNGFAVLIGTTEFGGGMGPGLVIANNIITVENSSLMGLGYSTFARRGNGYGLLLGMEHGGIVAASGTASTTIAANAVNIISSSLGGNSYGILIGCDSFLPYSSGTSGLVNSAIYGNDIIISAGSALTGDRSYSSGANIGNAHGLHIGYGEYNAETSTVGSGNVINSSIYGNNISISSSSLIGNGYESYSSNYSGNGYGLTIGYRNIITETFNTGDAINIATYDNNILILGSTLAANGNGSGANMSGNAYGVMVGADYITKVGSGITNTVQSNNIALNASTINSTSAGASGYAWGINIGNNADTALINGLSITKSTINLDASTRNAYGVWMLLGSGTLNIDAFTAGAITRNDVSVLGCKVSNPIGGCTATW
jgi:hypothetical protein